MKYRINGILAFLLIAMLFQGCDDSLTLDTNKDVYSDDISDITYLNNSFFSTNYDLSYNAGSQIDLLRFEKNDQDIYLEDGFDLGLNGQGYMAITNDNQNVFLQSRNMSTIFCYSTIGEMIYSATDSVSTSWQPSGICFITDKDSLLLLYRNLNSPKQYRARIVDKSNPYKSSSDDTFNINFIDTTYYGVYAIEYKEPSFFMLGVNNTGQDVLIQTDQNFEVTSTETIPDSTVVGLCFDGDDLYLSYRDRRIERWNSY